MAASAAGVAGAGRRNKVCRALVIGSERLTRLARGPQLFDAARFPRIEFVSDPYPVALLRSGGPLHGVLEMHGVRRRQAFLIAPTPADCAKLRSIADFPMPRDPHSSMSCAGSPAASAAKLRASAAFW